MTPPLLTAYLTVMTAHDAWKTLYMTYLVMLVTYLTAHKYHPVKPVFTLVKKTMHTKCYEISISQGFCPDFITGYITDT